MITFESKFQGEYNLEYRPRVYFTCHPDDFDCWFGSISDDILGAYNDCVIYYTKDMTEIDEEMYTDALLGRMNLFVIPVTYRLLTSGCRAFVRDLAFARERNIPILPIMVECGIDDFYSPPEAFGNMQYLSPHDNKPGGRTYGEKLAHYLANLFVSGELIKEIKDAFDGEIFLSYRKKDRAFAYELIQLIHSNPKFRDIAIWYDDFLMPSEDFEKNIFGELDASDLFALLVTPNLLEDGNYVMKREYPMARESGKPILPTEVAATDRDELSRKYAEIPEPIDGNDSCVLDERLTAMLNRLSNEGNNDPRHNYLMGMAYLDGIHVEKNIERAIELITLSAEAGHFEAMETIQKIYAEGLGVTVDPKKAVMWAEKLVACAEREYGPNDEKMIKHLNTLTTAYDLNGDYARATKTAKRVYYLSCSWFDEMQIDIIVALYNLSCCYMREGKYGNTLSTLDRFFKRNKDKIDENSIDIMPLLYLLAACYAATGKNDKVLPLSERLYRVIRRCYGDNNKYTLDVKSSLAMHYSAAGENEKAIEMSGEAYKTAEDAFGEKDTLTLKLRNNYGYCYQNARKIKEAVDEYEAVLAVYIEIYGKTHPHTLLLMNNVGSCYNDLGRMDEAITILHEAHQMYCNTGMGLHPSALICLQNIAGSYKLLKDYPRAIDFYEKAYNGYKGLDIEMLAEIVDVTGNLALLYAEMTHVHGKNYERYRNAGSMFAANNALWAYENAKKKNERYKKECEEAKARLALKINN